MITTRNTSTYCGCVRFDQSKGLTQSKIAIVQIGILIWFQIFVPFNETAVSIARKCSFIYKHGGSKLVRAKVIYTPPLFYAAKEL